MQTPTESDTAHIRGMQETTELLAPLRPDFQETKLKAYLSELHTGLHLLIGSLAFVIFLNSLSDLPRAPELVLSGLASALAALILGLTLWRELSPSVKKLRPHLPLWAAVAGATSLLANLAVLIMAVSTLLSIATP